MSEQIYEWTEKHSDKWIKRQLMDEPIGEQMDG